MASVNDIDFSNMSKKEISQHFLKSLNSGLPGLCFSPYLEGQNIELMANSDNVLRGGLTPKHIDIEELLEHIKFEPTYPNMLIGYWTRKLNLI